MDEICHLIRYVRWLNVMYVIQSRLTDVVTIFQHRQHVWAHARHCWCLGWWCASFCASLKFVGIQYQHIAPEIVANYSWKPLQIIVENRCHQYNGCFERPPLHSAIFIRHCLRTQRDQDAIKILEKVHKSFVSTNLKVEYCNFCDGVRFGKILEDIDALPHLYRRTAAFVGNRNAPSFIGSVS